MRRPIGDMDGGTKIVSGPGRKRDEVDGIGLAFRVSRRCMLPLEYNRIITGCCTVRISVGDGTKCSLCARWRGLPVTSALCLASLTYGATLTHMPATHWNGPKHWNAIRSHKPKEYSLIGHIRRSHASSASTTSHRIYHVITPKLRCLRANYHAAP